MSETKVQSFDGEIKKCPGCGAVLPSMAAKYPEGEIFAAPFHDRIVHHIYYAIYLSKFSSKLLLIKV